MAEEDVQTTLTTLTSQLDVLEESLKPLLASNYTDLVSAQQSPLTKAKLNVLLSYAVHDLIWVYLKTAGVDPATHPVMPEIDRLKTYFAKLKSAETGQPIPSATPITTQRRMQIDKQAASRFITHAINSQKSRIDPDYQAEGEEGAEEFEVEGGKHTRFDAPQEREGENEEVERLLDDEFEESEEEEEKEVVKKGKGKEKESKKGRKALDPFAGYDQPKPSRSTTTTQSKSVPSSAEKRKRSDLDDSPATPSTTTTTAGDASASASKKKKKDGKKGKGLKIKK